MHKFLTSILLAAVALLQPFQTSAKGTITLDTNKIISDNYIGNGAQWDPYDIAIDPNGHKISAEDWRLVCDRLDFMRIRFIRMMVNSPLFYSDGKLNATYREHLKPLLDYCESRKVVVMFGDWGGNGLIKEDLSGYNIEVVRSNVALLKALVDEGYSCIKYYNLINEPNGNWSVTNTKYDLWRNTIEALHTEAQRAKILDKVQIVAPDAAIWNAKPIKEWITPVVETMDDKVGLYDIHTYPTKSEVNNGAYGEVLKRYRSAIPKDKQIVMGEIGFKYHKKRDSLLFKQNLQRAKRIYTYATPQDSQTFVFDHFYGTDMADALIQTLNAGFSGSIIWMLDDAMHRLPTGLKVWGFWNILGSEMLNKPETEQVRPFYYAWSLLTRYMPTGSTIYSAEVEGVEGVRATITSYNGSYMIAIVNTTKEPQQLTLKSSSIKELKGAKRFDYEEGKMRIEGDHTMLPNAENLKLQLSAGEDITLAAESMVVYSTFNF